MSAWLYADAGVAREPRLTVSATERPWNAQRIEHRYRVLGRVRLLLFWSGSTDVGAARMTWHQTSGSRAIALLIGSDPSRAPRAVNEWAYVREEVRPSGTEAFEVRSLTSPGFNPEPTVTAHAQNHMFGAVCSSSGQDHVQTWTTAIESDVSYRTFGRLLEQIAKARRWDAQKVSRPSGAEAGFLMALQRLIGSTLEHSTVDGMLVAARAPVVYPYKGTIYDLNLRKVRDVGTRSLRSGQIDDLVRADFSIRNRTTGDVSKFWVTFATRGTLSGIPVQITFQPNWWLSVEVQLDESVDVPADPATDAATLARIRGVCATARN